MTGEFELVGQWTPIDTPEYTFEVEEFRRGEDQMVFVHLHVWKFNKTILKRIFRDFRLFRECVPGPIYTAGTSDDDKFFHFVSLFGWKPISEALCTDGKRRRIFLHIKDDKKNVSEGHATDHAVVPTVSDATVVGTTSLSITGVPGRG